MKQWLGGRIGLTAVLSVMAVGLTSAPGSAAEPSRGTIRWGQSVRWSGGPLYGTEVSPYLGHTGCRGFACDEFLLDIRVPPSPNPNLIRFVQIEIESADSDLLFEALYPPGAETFSDFNMADYEVYRLLAPEAGVWRIQVICSVSPCQGATYEGRATTSSIARPTAVAHRAGGRSLGVRKHIRAHLHQVGTEAFEPTLGITSDGSIVFQGLLAAPFLPKVMRSTDGGRTWKDVSPQLGPVFRHPSTNDPFLHVDELTDRVFTADMHGLACVEVSSTDDEGERWTTSLECQNNPDHQNLFTAPPVLARTIGYPDIVYLCVNGIGTSGTWCSKSLDGALTFVPTGTPAFPTPRCGGLSGHGVGGTDGAIYVPRGVCGQPFLAISRNEGLTWTRHQIARNGMPEDIYAGFDHEAAVDADRKGNLYYTWVAHDRLPYLAVSKDGGRSWTEPMMVGPPGLKEAALPAIDVGAPGKVAIAYMGSVNSPGSPFPGEGECSLKNDPVGNVVGCPAPKGYEKVTWNGYITTTGTALAKGPVFYTAPVNHPTDPLVRGECGPGRCSGAGDFFDVAIAPDGTPWAAFTDACVVDRCTTFETTFGDGIAAQMLGGPALR